MSRVTLRRPLPPSRNTLSDTMRFQIARPLRSAMVEGIQKGTVLTSYRHLTAATDSLQGILERNRKWSEEQKKAEPTFFSKLANIQTPQWLWIGCSDSRVPANQLMGLGPGEVFVQRNVGNLVTHKDMNAMSCLEYAVTALKVKHIIVCGHHNCGAVKGALTMPNRQQGTRSGTVCLGPRGTDQITPGIVGAQPEGMGRSSLPPWAALASSTPPGSSASALPPWVLPPPRSPMSSCASSAQDWSICGSRTFATPVTGTRSS
uniref:Carbonic anhydrase n=1 Tax=Auxenochlorella protothecoides TaxID=3075 RepID=A0A1D2AAW4_AUXPR